MFKYGKSLTQNTMWTILLRAVQHGGPEKVLKKYIKRESAIDKKKKVSFPIKESHECQVEEFVLNQKSCVK